MTEQTQHRFIRLPEVMQKTGASRSSIYAWMKQQAFPRQMTVGPRTAVWLESEIDSWIERHVTRRDTISRP